MSISVWSKPKNETLSNMDPGAASENNLEVSMATIEWYFTTEVFYDEVDAMINNKELAVTTIE